MPKNDVDYSKTIIYKIACNDPKVKEVYIGHTTSFIKRKYQHKKCCKNLNNTIKIYETIRATGGWDNWTMSEIATYNCNNAEEARIKEQEHYEEEMSLLNSVKPYSDECNKNIYNCKTCFFKTHCKRDFERHLATDKHKRITKETKMDDVLNNGNFVCKCGNNYKYRQGLWKHKKLCFVLKNQEKSQSILSQDDAMDDATDEEKFKILTNLVIDVVKQNQDVVKQNQDLTNKIIDICTNPNTNNTNNNNTNNISNSNIHSNNKTFNLQFFLNDTCKNAMNMSDFVNQIQISIRDLEETGELGYTEGISKIIIKNLNEIYYKDRPIHCSDSKRETLYIKEDNMWIKEDQSNGNISKAIKQIAHKNIKKIPEWVKMNPNCYDSESTQNDKYLQIVSNSMSGGTETEQKTNINKIISKIAKEVTIDKYNITI